MTNLLKRFTPYLIGFILGILSFIPFTRQTTIASFLTGFGSNTEVRGFNVNGRAAADNYSDMLKLAGAQTRGDTSANAMFGLIDTLYGNRAGTARNEAVKLGYDGSAGGFVWFIGRPA